MKRKIDRIELEGDSVTIYRDGWRGKDYQPRLYWLDKICELATELVKEGKAIAELGSAGWYVDLVREG